MVNALTIIRYKCAYVGVLRVKYAWNHTANRRIMSDESLKSAFESFKSTVYASQDIERIVSKNAGCSITPDEFASYANEIATACKAANERFQTMQNPEDMSDEQLISYCRYTDGIPLKDYENTIHLVPALVNLVSLADAVPIDGQSLPFNLKQIAVKCRNAVYFAPRKFTAIQLAFDSPRSRVLLFRACNY